MRSEVRGLLMRTGFAVSLVLLVGHWGCTVDGPAEVRADDGRGDALGGAGGAVNGRGGSGGGAGGDGGGGASETCISAPPRREPIVARSCVRGTWKVPAPEPFKVSVYGESGRSAMWVDLEGEGRKKVVLADTSRDLERGDVLVLDIGDDGILERTVYPAAGSIGTLAAGDFDADGDQDIAVATAVRSTIEILENIDGVLGNSRIVKIPGGLSALISIAGKPGQADVLIGAAFEGDHVVVVRLGVDGETIYQVPIEGAPNRIVAADFDADGQVDLAVTLYEANRAAILYGAGSGFSSPVFLPISGTAGEIAAVDWNDDGLPDLAVTSSSDYKMHLFRNEGQRAFGKPVVLPLVQTASDIAVCELDHKPAIVTVSSSHYDAVLVTNLDAKPVVRRINGRHPSGTTFLCHDHLDDGDTDILSFWNGGLWGVENEGPRGWRAPTGHAGAYGNPTVVPADLNHDGIADLVIPGQEGTIEVRLGFGAGRFAAPVELPAGLDVFEVGVGDFDGDGHLDLVSAPRDAGESYLYRGDGEGQFELARKVAAYGTYRANVGDVDGDGLVDFLLVHPEAERLTVLYGDRSNPFTRRYEVPTPWPTDATILDMNCDGRPDLAATAVTSGEVRFHHQTGSGEFETVGGILAGGMPMSVRRLRLADGSGGLVVAVHDSEYVAILSQDAAGKWTSEKVEAPRGIRAAEAADLDRDGYEDLLLLRDDQLIARFGSANGFGMPVAIDAAELSTDLALADVDGDGLLDPIVASQRYSTIRVYGTDCRAP